MVDTLKMMCAMAICRRRLSPARALIHSANGRVSAMTIKSSDPIILNSRWTTAARCAVLLVPMEASSAVMQVPMFCPNRMNSEAFRPIKFALASACRIPIDADDDCNSAVISAPIRTPSRGLDTPVIIVRKPSQLRIGSIASVMVCIPTNRMPKPIKICPSILKLDRLLSKRKIKPITANMMPKSSLTDSMSEVTVVPMFAPMITPDGVSKRQKPRVHKSDNHHGGCA